MKVIELPLDEITPYARNPRKNAHAVDAIAASLKEFGWQQPIVIDSGKTIVAGDTRYKAARKLGYKTAPCVMASDLTPQQVQAYRILDNKLNEKAEWDAELLQLELAELPEFDFEAFEVEFPEVEKLLEAAADVSDDEVPETRESVVTRKGDLWLLGEHRVLCGDSTDPSAVSQLLGDDRPTLLLTDPPYGVDYTGKTADALKIENDSFADRKELLAFLESSLGLAHEFLVEGGVFYIFHADSEGLTFRMACQNVGLHVRQCLVWNKNSFVMGRQDYHWKHEPCLYGWKGGAAHHWGADRTQSTVLDFDRPTKNREHPTMKPLPLLCYLIANSSRKRDLVYDPFFGSGSSLIAAQRLERRAVGLELDPRYADVICRRFYADTGIVPVREADQFPFPVEG